MKKHLAFLFSVLFISTLFSLSSPTQAYEENIEESYAEKVEKKTVNGFTNIATAALEVPKNIINTTNDSNLIYGFTGGLFKGVVHMLGRMTAGFVDVITLPLPTRPISEPTYIWENFDIETSYNPVFRLDVPVEESALTP